MLDPRIRDAFSLDFSVKHFNHGAFGAIPNTVRTFQRALLEEIDRNPTGFYRRKLESRLEDARLIAARYIGAQPEGFAWVRNASEGLTVALNAIPLANGDEVVVTNQIYPSVRLALETKLAHSGASKRVVNIGIEDTDDQIMSKFEEAVTERTKLIAVDEISSPTGQVMPVRRIADLARKAGAVSFIDAAHAPGMYALNVDELGVDFWVGNFHKWVCAPHSAGCIWVSKEWRDRIRPSYVSFRDDQPFPGVFSRLGTDDQTAVLCVPVAIDFLAQLGAERVFEHNRLLAKRGAEVISAAFGTEVLNGNYAARHPIKLPASEKFTSMQPRDLQIYIAEKLQTELSVTEPMNGQGSGYLTISAFIYNDESEYAEFGALFATIVNQTNASESEMLVTR